METRIIEEEPRGCGHRVEGGTYLMGEIGIMGNLPSCVLIDPPIPIDQGVFPFSRGVYIVNFQAVLTESDQRLWSESYIQRDGLAWETERYGMPLSVRLKIGMCAGLTPAEAEDKLASLCQRRGTYPVDYILKITRAGKGRRVAREAAAMQDCRVRKDWRGLLAACWRLAGYDNQVVRDNIKRIMVSIGALEDAASF